VLLRLTDDEWLTRLIRRRQLRSPAHHVDRRESRPIVELNVEFSPKDVHVVSKENLSQQTPSTTTNLGVCRPQVADG